jgi:hypothetical protein
VRVQLHVPAFCAVVSKQSPRCTLTGKCRLLFILSHHPTLLRMCNLTVQAIKSRFDLIFLSTTVTLVLELLFLCWQVLLKFQPNAALNWMNALKWRDHLPVCQQDPHSRKQKLLRSCYLEAGSRVTVINELGYLDFSDPIYVNSLREILRTVNRIL